MNKVPIPGTGLLYLPIRGPGDEPDIPLPGSKRRRLRGACAECRQRKIRCDRAKRPNNVCSNCVAFNAPCTDAKVTLVFGFQYGKYPDTSNHKDPNGKTPAEHVDAIINHSTTYIGSQELRGVLIDVARYSRGLEEQISNYREMLATSSREPSVSISSPSSGSTSSTGDIDPRTDVDALIPDFQDLKIMGGRPHYFGRSSGHYLLQTAEDLKREHYAKGTTTAYQGDNRTSGRRLEFWGSPWEKPDRDPPRIYRFPPKDLMDDLINVYFNEFYISLPLLHQPSFRRDVADGKHLADNAFGAVVLAVCALAARHSDDPRVILPGTNSMLSAGWEWMEQIRYPEQKEFYFKMSLYELQRVMLTILYMQGTGTPSSSWTLVSLGLRNLQEMGKHRPRPNQEPNAEDELYKRVFWAFIVGDIYTSAFLGRPRATRDDDHDVEYPIECDDEYWEHPDPELRFKQPEGKPSIMAYLTSTLKLHRILAKAQATLYSLKRTSLNVGWGQATVAELDSNLNEWLDSIPDHLRWDPQRTNEVFAKQSACLYATYYHIQIQIHRNFISSPSNHTPLLSNFPSLTICSNAARACTRLIDNMLKRGYLLDHPQVLASLMDSALVLLVNVWGAQRSWATADPARAIADLKTCMNAFQLHEKRWQQAGRFCDMVLAMSDHILSDSWAIEGTKTLKRVRDTENEPATEDSSPGGPRVQADFDLDLSAFDLTSLPLSTAQLGSSLTEYPPFTMDWTESATAPASAFSYADFDFVFNFADSALQMPVAPLPTFYVPTSMPEHNQRSRPHEWGPNQPC
ncbi:Zn(2)-C6 fungal-type domain-containing protein [Mycena indigotica]|uniref:Zn(2)-C6 fungal-type domain-containing protein n=1 Tax=Mycena indigotica TaxID=2126181 RepID=A0A8H6TFM8_9AGAR|nr:Zn(2)-C6 fungal-type domain-containing protein [Mycena indigotica]KAF7315862.1 Zn(2)-C6 fungal-type domain-containing protein [Mycena indigotica]